MKKAQIVFILIVFTFFNNVGMPMAALQWTTILVPFLFTNYIKKYKFSLLTVLTFSLLLLLVHGSKGLVSKSYFLSYGLHFACMVLVFSFYDVLKKKPEIFQQFIKQAIKINLLLTIAALFFWGDSLFWTQSNLIYGMATISRLRLFTYEPSYYSLLLVPFLLYYYAQINEKWNSKLILPVLTLCFSFALSLSFGVISTLAIVIGYSLLFKVKRKVYRYLSISFISLAFIILYKSLSNNVLFLRMLQVLNGEDISGNARLLDPWIISNQILDQYNSHIFGIGWGNISKLGREFIHSFYNYSTGVEAGNTLPNIVIEIYTLTGIFGLSIYFFIQLYFYKKTSVKSSFYRSCIFWFIFIYQFTGSFSSSVLHYAFWVIAFTPQIDALFIPDTKRAIQDSSH